MQLGKAAPCGEGTLSQKTARKEGRQWETTLARPPGLFPRYDMDSAVFIQDNSIRGVALGRHFRSLSSEILAAGNRRATVQVACWNVRTMLRAQEMKILKSNIQGIREIRWPEDSDFWSDEFRIINSR